MSASYNNSFGQSDVGASNVGTISSGDTSGIGPVISGDSGGDIIISSSDGSRGGKRRWPIVVAILLFLVAIGAGVGALMIGKPSGGGSGDMDAKSTFNRYANYLLYGENTSKEFGKYMGLRYIYYFDEQKLQDASDDEQADLIVGYYDAISDKIKNFYDAYNKNENGASSSFVGEYVEGVLSFAEINRIVFLDSDNVWELYKNSGYDDAYSKVEMYYSTLLNSEYDTPRSLGTIMVELSKKYLDRFEAYSATGCTVDDACNNEDISSINNEIIVLNIDADVIVNNNREKVLEGCWKVYEKL